MLSTASTSVINNEMILQEADRDDFLRILNQKRHQMENEALLVAEQGDVEKLRRLVADGLDLACTGFKGYTLLHHAASRGHCAVIAELVRHRRIAIDSPNEAGETPLHLAVYGGHLLAVDQLLDYGATINAVNHDGESCLFYAARKSTAAIVRLLLQRGADVCLRDRYDDLALDHATNPLVLKAFQQSYTGSTSVNSNSISTGTGTSGVSGSCIGVGKGNGDNCLSYDNLLHVFRYFSVQDVLRAACVSSKWHRVSEHEGIWKCLGVRRWELALQSRLGFAPTTTMSFLNRPRSKSSLDRNSAGNGVSGGRLSRTNSGRTTPSQSTLVAHL
jgi:hypothetical protein